MTTVYTKLFILFTAVIGIVHADDKPNIDYSKKQPYRFTKDLVVEVLSEKRDKQIVFRYFYMSREMPLKRMVDTIRETRAALSGYGSKVMVLHEKGIAVKKLEHLKNNLVDSGTATVTFLEREELKGDLLKYIKRRRENAPTITTVRKHIPAIEADFNRISQSMISLSTPVEDASNKSIDKLVKACRSFLKKHEIRNTHQFYRLAERRLERLLAIQAKKKKK